MNRIAFYLLVLSFMPFVFFPSCKGPKNDQQKIEEMEKILMEAQGGALDPQLGNEMIKNYVDFVNKNHKNELAPTYLFRAADIALNMDEPERSIHFLEQIQKNYPEFEKIEDVLFLKGFIYENNIRNLGKAKEAYDEFLNKYPEHEMADEVRMIIQNLGKTPEELIKEFEANKKD